MKKRLLLAGILLIFIGSAVKAQTTFNYGLKAGLNFANTHGAGMKKSFSPGFQGGVYGEWDFSPKWGVQAEVLFTQQQAKRDQSFFTYYVLKSNSEGDAKAKLSQITVPVLLRYHILPSLVLNLGVQYNYTFFLNENYMLYNLDAFKKNDIQGVIGAQVQVANCNFFLRYALGVDNVNNIDNRYTWETQQINLGIGIDLTPRKDKKATEAKK